MDCFFMSTVLIIILIASRDVFKEIEFNIDNDKLKFNSIDRKIMSYSIQRIVLTFLENIQFFLGLHMSNQPMFDDDFIIEKNWANYRKSKRIEDLLIPDGRIDLIEHFSQNTDHDLSFSIAKMTIKLEFIINLPSGVKYEAIYEVPNINGNVIFLKIMLFEKNFLLINFTKYSKF